MKELKAIIIHCSATRALWMSGNTLAEQAQEIRRWHVQENGWSDIGYHGLFGRLGDYAEGRSLERDGAHTLGHNRDTLGLCLIGGHGSSETDAPEDHYTPEQLHALASFLQNVREVHPDVPIHGHNEFAAKACPGFSVPDWLESIGIEAVPKSVPAEVPDAALIEAALNQITTRRRFRRG